MTLKHALALLATALLLAFAPAPALARVAGSDYYPPAVVSAGAQAAWRTPQTCGPTPGTSFAAASTLSGANITKSSPNFDVNGGTLTASGIDFTGWNLWAYNGAVVSLSNIKIKCLATGCTTGNLVYLGLDSGGNPQGPATVTIDRARIDGTGFRLAQQMMQAANTSTWTISNSCLTRAPIDYITTGGNGVTLNVIGNYFTAFGVNGVAGPVGDHGEDVHFYGPTCTISGNFFNFSAGPTSAGITAEVFLDSTQTPQTCSIDHNIFLHDGRPLYVILAGGNGSIININHNVMQKGANGHYVNDGGGTLVNGGNNYDYQTGALITVF